MYILFHLRLPHKVHVAEDECLLHIEATCDNVLGILIGQSVGLLERQVLPQELLVVGHLNHERHIKSVLQPLGDHKRDEMTQMHGLRGRTTAGV